jgi:hypothetical protein
MKPRLFCFGDSFSGVWNIPKFDWTSYISHHYEIYKFGVCGADNNSIIFQLGDLPEFQTEDRILIVFTEPSRIPMRFYFNGNLVNKLACLTVDEYERWLNGERNNEIKFFKKLKILLKEYNPIFVTWNETFHKGTEDFVSLIQVSSNWQEGTAGEERDYHPGPKGSYDMYKKIHTLLDVNEPFINFKIEDKDLI